MSAAVLRRAASAVGPIPLGVGLALALLAVLVLAAMGADWLAPFDPTRQTLLQRLRHILPNIAGPLLVVATAEFGLMILFEASLSFLGLGIQPPTPSLGSILSSGRQYLDRAWWLTLVPGATLFALVLSVNVFGDWLRDRLYPRSRSR